MRKPQARPRPAVAGREGPVAAGTPLHRILEIVARAVAGDLARRPAAGIDPPPAADARPRGDRSG